MENNSENPNKPANQNTSSDDVAPVSYNEEIKKKKPITMLVVFIAVIFAAAAIFYFVRSSSQAEELEQQKAELDQTYYQLDSISTQLNDKILTISQLGGQVDTLIAIRDQLEAEKAQLRKTQNSQSRQIRNLKDRVGGYQELLLQQDEEIARLKVLNEELLSENTDLKTERNSLNQTITSLNDEKSQLQEKVATASQLKTEGMEVVAINKRGKEYKNEFRSRNIDKLRVQFYITENKVAPIEGKDILLKIIGTDNNVLFDVATGSGTFIFEGREMFYTAKQEILYDRTKKQVLFTYDKGSEYVKGLYKVEIYTDAYLMGRGSFTVK
ncbi:MAG: chromosome segregation protein SMC [bacterium]|nr:chromosome segregation protein SMC [bacterium]